MYTTLHLYETDDGAWKNQGVSEVNFFPSVNDAQENYLLIKMLVPNSENGDIL